MDVVANDLTFDGDVSAYFSLTEADVGVYRFTITGTGIVNFQNRYLGCIMAEFTIEEFDE